MVMVGNAIGVVDIGGSIAIEIMGHNGGEELEAQLVHYAVALDVAVCVTSHFEFGGVFPFMKTLLLEREIHCFSIVFCVFLPCAMEAVKAEKTEADELEWVFYVKEHKVVMTTHTYNLPHHLIFEEFWNVVGPVLHKVPPPNMLRFFSQLSHHDVVTNEFMTENGISGGVHAKAALVGDGSHVPHN